MIRETWAAFEAAFEAGVGISPWALSGALLAFCVSAVLLQAALRPALAAKQRARLFGDLPHFLRDASEACRQALLDLDQRRMAAHGVAWVRGASVEELAHLPGSGRPLLGVLRKAGFLRLAEVMDRGLEGVDGVSAAQVGQIRRHLNDRLGEVRGRAAQWKPGSQPPFPADPRVEAIYAEHAQTLRRRLAVLQADAGSVQRLRAAPTAGGAPAPWRRPRAVLGHLAADVVTVAALSAWPLLLLLWDETLGPEAAVFGLTLAWATVHLWAALAAFTAGWAPPLGRAPNPGAFAEQRLQLEGIAIAHAAGVAPPRISLVDVPTGEIHVQGDPRGPSQLVLGAGLLALDEAGRREAMRVAVERLRGGAPRRDAARRVVLSPLRRAAHLTARATRACLRPGPRALLLPLVGPPCLALSAVDRPLRLLDPPAAQVPANATVAVMPGAEPRALAV